LERPRRLEPKTIQPPSKGFLANRRIKAATQAAWQRGEKEMEDEEKTQILHRITSGVIFEANIKGETRAIRRGLAVKAALKAKIDLSGANLSGADLSGADLRGVNLQGADLQRADLRRANLHGADLLGINLHGVDLRGTVLKGADLRGVNLDFSSGISFGCWSFGFKCDFRLIAQIMCHVARLESDDPQAMEIIAEVRHRWGNDFCEFRDDVLPGNWDEESKEGSEKTPCP
jgi:hypothetical protein